MASSWNYIEPFISKLTYCFQCKAPLKEDSNPPAEITVYTRYGTKFAQHFGKECSNRAGCRLRFYDGYYYKNGDKVYDDLSLQGKYLITSANTAFSIEYLYEINLYFLHGTVAFEAHENVYNQLHNFDKSKLISRTNICRKRISDAFLFMHFLKWLSGLHVTE